MPSRLVTKRRTCLALQARKETTECEVIRGVTDERNGDTYKFRAKRGA
jgi:hypothetical protein